MLVSYKWLSQYVDLEGVSAKELAEKMTRSGIEIENVYNRSEGIKDVVVGHVIDKKQHPDADKLSVCQVELGQSETVQIVCGAPNVAAGQKVPVAKVGAVLPDNFKIKKAKLRGQESHGMICSAKELGIEEKYIAPEHRDGIMILPSHLETGMSALEQLDLNDWILELELTPNRSDCLSMLGVAYEVASILGREVRLPESTVSETNTQNHVSVTLEATDLCPHYIARKVINVTIQASPLWLQNRLIAAGIRPINNVVDVTNYVMLEYGQPLHAFDAQRVKDEHIIVRRAKEGEAVVTLDDQTRQLKGEMLVIADPEKVIAIAGVMGAANSEVTEATTDIILESAYFDGASVRLSSKEVGLRSEASLRFEKGVDPESVGLAIDRAASLLAEVAGGEVLEGISQQDVSVQERREILLHTDKVNQVLGTALSLEDIKGIFKRLQFENNVTDQGNLLVAVPTRRQDITIEEDLFEEVARLYGYDHIPTTFPDSVTTQGARTRRQSCRQIVKHFLQAAGLHQVVNYSLTSKQQATQASLLQKEDIIPIGIAMPMSEERSHLRTSLIPQLFEVISYNRNRKQEDIHLFELGKVYISHEEVLTALPEEKEHIAGVISGLWENHPWQHEKKGTDFYVLKGIVEGLLLKLGLAELSFEAVQAAGFHPGRTAKIKSQGHEIGVLGQMHPQLEKTYDIKESYAFEISLDKLLTLLPADIMYVSLPKYPGIQRDLAVVVDQATEAGMLEQLIKKKGQPLLKSVQLFDLYEGERIEKDKKSVAFSLYYQDPEKTLTDEEVQQVHQQIVSTLEQDLGAKLR
jgi:phenylalanyl-tRNA synthetase beta chain